jgi:hypothetical protein
MLYRANWSVLTEVSAKYSTFILETTKLFTLKMGALSSSKTSIAVLKPTQRNVPKHLNAHQHRC